MPSSPLAPTLIDFSPHRGVLIERAICDADFLDGRAASVEGVDWQAGTLQRWVSVAEAEDLGLLYPEQADEMRAQIAAARTARTSEAA